MTNLLAILAAGSEDSGGGLFSFAFIPLVLLAMYFIIVRPNSKRRKEQISLQSSLTVGDEVMTTAGIIGTITGEDGPDRFWLEIDDDVQVRIARGGIQGQFVAGDTTDTTDADDGETAVSADDTDGAADDGASTDPSDRD